MFYTILDLWKFEAAMSYILVEMLVSLYFGIKGDLPFESFITRHVRNQNRLQSSIVIIVSHQLVIESQEEYVHCKLAG